jgi:hypothetical protein
MLLDQVSNIKIQIKILGTMESNNFLMTIHIETLHFHIFTSWIV